MSKEEKKELRFGYSTGACATALAVTAYTYHQNRQLLEKVELLFLDDVLMTLPLLEPLQEHAYLGLQKTPSPLFRIRKDGGDDPDCTHEAILYGYLEEASLSDMANEDYCLTIGQDTFIIHAIEGIGLSTRIGLDCEQGHWAINTGPREMIRKNLERVGMGQRAEPTQGKVWRFCLGVENGTVLAKNTLNPHLGVVGGISILGTTGHVRPYSHDAYIETVRICVRSNHLTGGNHMVFCTGGRSQKMAKNHYPQLNEASFVSIGDFIAESIESAQKYEMQTITVACMVGKLCKYAAKFENTHAHNVAQDMELLREEIVMALKDEKLMQNHHDSIDTLSVENLSLELQKANSVREALLYIPENIRQSVLDKLADKALDFFHSLYPTANIGILLCGFGNDIIFEKRTEELRN